MGTRSNSDRVPLMLPDLSPGLFVDRGLLDIPPGGASAVLNVVWRNGYLTPRAGFQVFPGSFSSVGPIVHLCSGYDANANLQLFAFQQVNNNPGYSIVVYNYNFTTSTWINVSTNVSIGYTPGLPITTCFFKYTMYVNLGIGFPLKYVPGTGMVDIGGTQADTTKRPPAATSAAAANDSSIFLTGGTNLALNQSYPARISWCDFLDDSTWGGQLGAGLSGYQDLPGAGDSSPITGIYVNNLVIMVFKQKALYLGTFVGAPRYYAFRLFLIGPGCVSQSSIQEYRDGKVVWLGDDNVYMGTPGEQPVPIGDKIRNFIRENLSLANLSSAVGLIDKINDLYTLFLPRGTDGKNYVSLTCNLRNTSWWYNSYQIPDPVLCVCTYSAGPWNSRLLIGTAGGAVLEHSFDFSSDLGQSFSCYWQSGVIQARQLTGTLEDQASLQTFRAFSPDGTQASPTQVTLSVFQGNGLDRFQQVPFGIQIFNGVDSKVYTSERATAENFMLNVNFSNLSQAPRINALWCSFVTQGPTR